MKIIYLIVFSFLLHARPTQAQSPVNWEYLITRVDDTAYEIHITARIQKGWHLYSQNQPADAIATPTKISFSANPLIKLRDKTLEKGKLVTYTDTSLGISAFEYENIVVFVQKFIRKAAVKTSIIATVSYQVCSNEKCLPVKAVLLNIPILKNL